MRHRHPLVMGIMFAAVTSVIIGATCSAEEPQRLPIRPLWSKVTMNGGAAYRVPDALAGAVWDDSGVVIWNRKEGRFVQLREAGRLFETAAEASGSFSLYRVDLTGDGVDELLIVPASLRSAGGKVKTDDFAVTILEKRDGTYQPFKPLDGFEVNEYHVADVRDVRRGGLPSLLLTADGSQEDGTQHHLLVWYDDGQLRWQAFGGPHVSVAWRDLDGSTPDELLVTKPFGTEGVSAPWICWTDVYYRDGKQYAEANLQFAKSFAREVIPELVEHLLLNADAVRHYPDDPERGVRVLEQHAAAIDRANQIVRAAGLDSIQDAARARDADSRGLKAIPRNWPAAHQAFAEASALNPQSAEAMYHLGWVEARTGRCPEALVHFRRSLGLNPRKVVAWYRMGICLAAQGSDQAVKAFYNYLTFSQYRKQGRYDLWKLGLVMVEKNDQGVRAAAEAALRGYPSALLQ